MARHGIYAEFSNVMKVVFVLLHGLFSDVPYTDLCVLLYVCSFT